MTLMKISEYRETQFTPTSRPQTKTVQRWIRNGEIAGRQIGNTYYVDVDGIVPANDLVGKVLNDSQTQKA